MSDDTENDPESITFIGYRNAPPVPVAIDFDDRIFLIEFFAKNAVEFVTVNAASERDAIAKAVAKMIADKCNPYKYEGCRVSELEVITDDADLAGGVGSDF